jgi:hypothetical protein
VGDEPAQNGACEAAVRAVTSWLQDRVEDNADYSAPMPHVFAVAKFLMFKCPTTNRQSECDVATDAANLAKVWNMTKDVRCRTCGEMHQIKIRDAFLDMAVSREIVTTR